MNTYFTGSIVDCDFRRDSCGILQLSASTTVSADWTFKVGKSFHLCCSLIYTCSDKLARIPNQSITSIESKYAVSVGTTWMIDFQIYCIRFRAGNGSVDDGSNGCLSMTHQFLQG